MKLLHRRQLLLKRHYFKQNEDEGAPVSEEASDASPA